MGDISDPVLSGKQKAVVGALVSALIAFLTAVLVGLQALPGAPGLGDLTAEVWVTAAIGALAGLGVTGGSVYAVRNKPR